ncbi:unnamed protein product [Larinioides sclopetarius]|uniref:Uncharacterized protein n=1 Tax=Larinioides sclopetarius TaxID=280406 RepID=A0AAV2BBM6_9ARAC
MEAVGKHTLFILGDRQVGKTTIINRVFANRELIFAGATDDAIEYHVYLQGPIPIKVLEIRNSAFLTENEIEVDDQRDVVIFCYAIDDPESFQHIADRWIPLFEQHANNAVTMILLGNKKDLRYDPEVINDLAARGLQPVSVNQGNELYCRYDRFYVFLEMGSHFILELNQLIDAIDNGFLNGL